MSESALRVIGRVGAHFDARRDTIRRHLKRFRPEVRHAVAALAERHPRAADLVLSFPALAVALAKPHARFDTEHLIGAVIAGAPLAELARMAKMPLWTRALPPEAFSGPPPRLPHSSDFHRRVASYVPSLSKDVARWLEGVAFAAYWCDEEFGVWYAHECLRAPVRRRRRPTAGTKLLTLWAWTSRRPNVPAYTLLDRVWTPAMSIKAAQVSAATWWNAVDLLVHMGEASLADAWLAPAAVDGYEFVPLCSAADIIEEARAMQNCLRIYGADLAENYSRFWSVRQGRQRIATLRLDSERGVPMPRLIELQALRNQPVPAEVWLAAHRWLLGQDFSRLCAPRVPCTVALNRAVWRSLWKPYWLEKGRLPVWLPLAPTWNVMRAF